MKEISFVCPECGGNTLIVVKELWESYHVLGLQSEAEALGIETNDDYLYLKTGAVIDSEDIAVISYECDRCQFEIGHTEEEAIKWLTEHGMLG